MTNAPIVVEYPNERIEIEDWEELIFNFNPCIQIKADWVDDPLQVPVLTCLRPDSQESVDRH